MENLQRELTNYFKGKIDAAIHKEIGRQQHAGVKRNNNIWHIELLETDLELSHLIKIAVDTVVKEWVVKSYDLKAYESISGMYCIKTGRLYDVK